MRQTIRLNSEERQILGKLTNAQLLFLKRIAQDKEFATLKDIVNVLIDIEKNIFFGENETKFTPDVLYGKHAYARGGIAKLVALVHLLVGAEQELTVREQERQKRIREQEKKEE